MRLSDAIGMSLEWTQPAMLRAEYDLRAPQGEVLGSLRFRNSFGSRARAEMEGGCWTLKRRGFLQTSVTIRVCDAESELAVFTNSTWSRGGTLDLPGGRQVKASTNFWQTRYHLADAADQPLVEYQPKCGLRMSGQMEILQPAASLGDDLRWIVILGWYLAVMMSRDSAAAT